MALRYFLLTNVSINFSYQNFNNNKTEKSIGATFLAGEHYLVDAIGNLMRVNEDGGTPVLVPNRKPKE